MPEDFTHQRQTPLGLRHVKICKKGDMLVAWFPLLKWYPEICHVCFASSVFSLWFSSLKKNSFAWFHQRLLLLYFYLGEWFVSWAQCLGLSLSFLTLLSDIPELQDSNFPWQCGLKKEHILAIDKLFWCFSLWIFQFLILIVSEVLSYAIYMYQFIITHHPGHQSKLMR